MENDIVFSDEQLSNKYRGTTDARIKIKAGMHTKETRLIQYIETGILILGTIIRGFGDLLFVGCCDNCLANL